MLIDRMILWVMDGRGWGHRYFEVFPYPQLEGLRKITDNLGQNSQSPGREPLVYEAGVLNI